ncbi:hypothetical protein BDP27DRAFT_1368068 [Rhodocollybia butyracea]|uniref:RING-type domain-containing protein n=1 Tax=Rhodocollybia butyracea TaxID=206335 RepID=A0A9P5U2D4_9AGAR|nr:hypothetical protein BDP27DRAFT_1368068 [Rhodocollybia butyracea]
MPSSRELATPRLRQHHGRRIRAHTNSPATGRSSSPFFQTRQSTPVYRRRSARLQEQQRSGDPHSPAIELSNGKNKTAGISNTVSSMNSRHSSSPPTVQEFHARQREVENARVQFSDFKDAQRVRFTCPICLRLAVKPRVTGCGHIFCGECLMQQRNYCVQNGGLMRCGAEIDALAEGSLDAERSSFVWFSSYESL